MTIVDDLAQTGAAWVADSWAQVLDPLVPGRWRTERLTVNYRTPKEAMAVAAALLPPGVEPPQSVRDGDEMPWCAYGGDLAALVRHEAELIGAGRVAVIAPPAQAADTAAALALHPGPDLDAPIAVLTPAEAKGLEFDSVVVVDPSGIEQASPRGRADLYVALTRTTRRLGLVITGDVPRELAAALSRRTATRRPRCRRLCATSRCRDSHGPQLDLPRLLRSGAITKARLRSASSRYWHDAECSSRAALPRQTRCVGR
jgi:hypothetical protein